MTSVVALMWMLGAFVLIAWLLLPFAMFGVKPLLRQLLNETQETNRLLATQGLIRRPPPQPQSQSQPQPQPQRQRPSFADAKIQEDYVQ